MSERERDYVENVEVGGLFIFYVETVISRRLIHFLYRNLKSVGRREGVSFFFQS